MDRATLQAFGRTYKVGVLDDKGAVKTMYEDEHGQKWIAVTPGDETRRGAACLLLCALPCEMRQMPRLLLPSAASCSWLLDGETRLSY